ncbi:MAG: hypothetical protein C4295_10510 [Candidatus Fervidibacterota bacterium]
MRQGQTLAALLVVTLIIAIIAAFLYVGRQGETQRQRGQQQTTYGMALERAKEVECMNNLHQIRSAIQMLVAENGANPPNLHSVRLPAGVQPVCPITKVPYTYDPPTGTVKCPQHPRF